jgi:hypothetical protein
MILLIVTLFDMVTVNKAFLPLGLSLVTIMSIMVTLSLYDSSLHSSGKNNSYLILICYFYIVYMQL